MIDINLVVHQLRKFGHSVETAFPVPENAGDWELSVDGKIIPLEEARNLLAADESRKAV